MEYNSKSNWASDFKSAEGGALSYFQITSTITPELYDTKSCYHLIMSVTKCEKHWKQRFNIRAQTLPINL